MTNKTTYAEWKRTKEEIKELTRYCHPTGMENHAWDSKFNRKICRRWLKERRKEYWTGVKLWIYKHIFRMSWYTNTSGYRVALRYFPGCVWNGKKYVKEE